MRHRVTWAVVAALLLGSFGCVAQAEKDRLQNLNRTYQEQVLDLQRQLEEKEARIQALMASRPAVDPELVAQLQQLQSERDRLQEALDNARQALLEASQMGTPLPQELNTALIELAQSNPQLMQYDPAAGMIKFQSDLTFASGSAEVGAGAQGSLQQLAQILGRPVARDYDVRVVGHTDNVKISRPATRQLHPTNWHLSVHRAIAVKDVLEKTGVPPQRMYVAGYGEYRPIVPNTATGAQANRRVEIFIVPRTGSPEPQAAQQPGPAPAAPQRTVAPPADEQPELFK